MERSLCTVGKYQQLASCRIRRAQRKVHRSAVGSTAADQAHEEDEEEEIEVEEEPVSLISEDESSEEDEEV